MTYAADIIGAPAWHLSHNENLNTAATIVSNRAIMHWNALIKTILCMLTSGHTEHLIG